MDTDRFAVVDRFFEQALLPPDDALDAALAASDAAGLPAIAVSAVQGKLLMLLAQLAGARRILEVGTLGGYSAVWLARGLADGGELVTLELDPHHAEVARANVARAGLAEVVDVRTGRAADLLADLEGPFDLVFIDADKPSNADYVRQALRLSRPGTLIIVDNVVRGGAVLHDEPDEAAQGVHRLLELVAAEPRLDATALQTVGSKGWDGVLVARVR